MNKKRDDYFGLVESETQTALCYTSAGRRSQIMQHSYVVVFYA